MPCGGIYPIAQTWAEPYLGENECFFCNEKEPKPDHFCDEWDCYLHAGCIEGFLKSEMGECVLLHGHGVRRGEEVLYEEKST